MVKIAAIACALASAIAAGTGHTLKAVLFGVAALAWTAYALLRRRNP